MSKIKYLLTGNKARYQGVKPINIYAMRSVYLLMVIFLGSDVWAHIFSYSEPWAPSDAMDWSVWAAFSLFALLGLFKTVEMIPILLLEVVYKLIWLVLVAVPLWKVGDLNGATTDGMIFPFALVCLPILAMPWGYVFKRYIYSWSDLPSANHS